MILYEDGTYPLAVGIEPFRFGADTVHTRYLAWRACGSTREHATEMAHRYDFGPSPVIFIHMSEEEREFDTIF